MDVFVTAFTGVSQFVTKYQDFIFDEIISYSFSL